MRILILNDDGYGSEGINSLIKFAESLTDDVWVVAPSMQCSGKSHSITIYQPMRMNAVTDKKNHYIVDSTPADCTIMALHYIMKDKYPDYVFSGINDSENLGDDVIYSGTVAGAREAALHGIKSIAFSQQHAQGEKANFKIAENNIAEVFDFINKSKSHKMQNNNLFNVNFPFVKNVCDVKGIKILPLGQKARTELIVQKKDERGKDYFWLSDSSVYSLVPGEEITNDIVGAASGYVTVTPLHLNLTDYSSMDD